MIERDHHSEADKVRDLPQVMQFIQGRILDIACGDDKITPDAFGVDGRDLPGVNLVTDDLITLWAHDRAGTEEWDTVFSSHYLEHSEQPFYLLECWRHCLKTGGYLVLYLPEKSHYNSHDNPEHLYNWSYEDFLFAFKRILCGEGKNYKGDHLPKLFEFVDSGLDIRKDAYSFYVIARKI
jgi:hypothetical protein